MMEMLVLYVKVTEEMKKDEQDSLTGRVPAWSAGGSGTTPSTAWCPGQGREKALGIKLVSLGRARKPRPLSIPHPQNRDEARCVT